MIGFKPIKRFLNDFQAIPSCRKIKLALLNSYSCFSEAILFIVWPVLYIIYIYILYVYNMYIICINIIYYIIYFRRIIGSSGNITLLVILHITLLVILLITLLVTCQVDIISYMSS